MKKKLIAIVLSAIIVVAAVVACTVMTVSAAGAVATNVTRGGDYSTLERAISAASSGDEIRLVSNISLNTTTSIPKNLTIDGNGKTLTYTGTEYTFKVSSNVTANFKNIKIIAPNGNGFKPSEGSNLSLTAVDMTVYKHCINGSPAQVDINSGNYLTTVANTGSDNTGRMYQIGGGTWNFKGGRHSGSATYMLNVIGNSTVNISGGFYEHFYSTGNLLNARDATKTFITGGYFYSHYINDAIYARENNGVEITISNGIFVSPNGKAAAAAKGSTAKVTVIGGNFYNTANLYPQKLAGASVRLNQYSSGLRFTSVIPQSVISTLNTIKDSGTSLSYGTLVIPTSKLSGVSAFSINALKSAGYKETDGKTSGDFLNIKATSYGTSTDEEGNIVINAAVIGFNENQYDIDLSAVAYVKFVRDGEECYLFSDYDEDADSRNIKEVAHRALADNDTSAYYTDSEVRALEKFSGEKASDAQYMTARVLSLNILAHEGTPPKGGSYNLYNGTQTAEDYNFANRLKYVQAMVDYAQPDIMLFQEFSGRGYWGKQDYFNLAEVSGSNGTRYTSAALPGYVWVNHGNRRGVLYKDNTQTSNSFHAHNFVLYDSSKFEYVKSGTAYVTSDGTIYSSWNDNSGGVDQVSTYPNYPKGKFDDTGDYTWVILKDKKTGLSAIYASTHTYNGSNQKYAYMLDNLQCMTNNLKSISAANGNIPIILGGDFNMWTGGDLFTLHYNHMTEVAGYIDSKTVGDNSGTTRVFGGNMAADVGSSKFGARIDYIFVNGGEPIKYEVLNGLVRRNNDGTCTYVKYPAFDGTMFDISDHLPIMTDVVISDASHSPASIGTYYKNPNTASDTVVSNSVAVNMSNGKITFGSGSATVYNKGMNTSLSIVNDAMYGNVLRIMATDETNYIDFAMKAAAGKGYTKVTVTYKVQYSISPKTQVIKFGLTTSSYSQTVSSGTLFQLDTSSNSQWVTQTFDISSAASYQTFGIYGKDVNTGFVNGDAIYIASIEFSK